MLGKKEVWGTLLESVNKEGADGGWILLTLGVLMVVCVIIFFTMVAYTFAKSAYTIIITPLSICGMMIAIMYAAGSGMYEAEQQEKMVEESMQKVLGKEDVQVIRRDGSGVYTVSVEDAVYHVTVDVDGLAEYELKPNVINLEKE